MIRGRSHDKKAINWEISDCEAKNEYLKEKQRVKKLSKEKKVDRDLDPAYQYYHRCADEKRKEKLNLIYTQDLQPIYLLYSPEEKPKKKSTKKEESVYVLYPPEVQEPKVLVQPEVNLVLCDP